MTYLTTGTSATYAENMDCNLRKRRIGVRLCELRGEATQGAVAEKLGVSTAAVSMYESGKRTPRDELKRKIARLYGKTVEEIFFAE